MLALYRAVACLLLGAVAGDHILEWAASLIVEHQRLVISLVEAARLGDVDLVRRLLAQRISTEVTDFRKENAATPLAWASQFGHLEIVEVLLAHGADVDAPDSKGDTPLSLAAFSTSDLKQRAEKVKCAETLLRHRADVNIRGFQGRFALHSAARLGEVSLVRSMLRYRAAVDCVDMQGWPPLFYAHSNTASVLLDNNASIATRGVHGQSALHAAASRGHFSLAELLIGKIPINDRDAMLRTPLHVVSQEALTRLLLKHKADIQARDEKGHTPLHSAARQGLNSVIKALLEHRAQDVTRDKAGFTPRDLAVRGGFVSAEQLLPRPGFAKTYSQVVMSRRFWEGLPVIACVVAGIVASSCRVYAEDAVDGPSRGAVVMAVIATLPSKRRRLALAFRVLDAFVCTVLPMHIMLLVVPWLGLPFLWCLLVCLQWLAFGWSPLRLALSTRFTSFVHSAHSPQWWMREAHLGFAVASLRVVLCLLVLYVNGFFFCDSDFRSRSWLELSRGRGALNVLCGNAQEKVCMPSVLNIFSRVPWTVEHGACAVDEHSCLTSPGYPNHYMDNQSCTIRVPRIATWTITAKEFETEQFCDNLSVNGMMFNGEAGPDGLVPRDPIYWYSDVSTWGKGWRLCPDHHFCVNFVSVRKLWQAQMVFELALAGLWFACVGSFVLIARQGRSRQDKHAVSRMVSLAAASKVTAEARRLAAEIEQVRQELLVCTEASTELKVSRFAELRGRSNPVEPDRAWRCHHGCLPQGIYADVLRIVSGWVLELNSAHTLFVGGRVWLGSIMVAEVGTTISLAIWSGQLWNLLSDIKEARMTGVRPQRLCAFADQNLRGGSLLTLLVTSYGLPLVVDTPWKAVTGGLSLMLSTVNFGVQMHRRLDLVIEQPDVDAASEQEDDADGAAWDERSVSTDSDEQSDSEGTMNPRSDESGQSSPSGVNLILSD